MKKAVILGSGSWGTSISMILSKCNIDVSIYSKNKDTSREINNYHTNSKYLPKITIPEPVKSFYEFEDSKIQEVDMIFLVIPSQSARELLIKLKKYNISKKTIIISCTKGLDPFSGKLMHKLIEEIFPNNPICVLSGPSHAEEVAQEMATLVTIGSQDIKVSKKVQKIFTLPWFRAYTSTDIIGIEVGGVVKNVFAIAAGISDNLKLGENAKSALLTRGLGEMTKIGVALGAKEETFRGLSGIGDLIVTCYSLYSRNNKVGRLLGQGKTKDEALMLMNQVAEGIPNSKNVYELSKSLNLRTPLIDEIYHVIHQNKKASKALKDLLNRNPKSETD